MELYEEIILNYLRNEEAHLLFPNLEIDTQEILKLESYRALKRIKEIIEDDTIDDKECFIKIEEIVRTFEKMGSDGGYRHDF
ncbi:MAG: hypothetical protein IJF40_01930 [Clostridia bacterium]|nr:hypothetical protein [Clostridia bacterium]